ncbi:type II secretion system F family protein [Halalkalibacter krulwichiae]|uniref:Type IV pilin biogenesis protein n=1 Tax=Halalkalibacter krulwichiae TaxID=199441 RepID=A0A1X9MDB7_9BACI|nr:type II secretion system F family protein [Halalkalibacter krulwichiae]ARK31435.1 type IV pilin biogenesis protein [Halalkalibacter krulwichiae]
MKVPLLKKYVQITLSYVFSLQLGKLLLAGMTLQQSLKHFENQDYLPFFQQECFLISIQLQRGQPFYEILEDKSYFCNELAVVVTNGEKTGYLAKDLEQYSDILLQELDDSIQKIIRLIQPTLFILVGGLVFLLFLVTLVPVFQMIGSM